MEKIWELLCLNSLEAVEFINRISKPPEFQQRVRIKIVCSSVGVVTGLGVERAGHRGSIPGSGRKLFPSKRPDRLRGRPGLPIGGYRGLSLLG